MKPVIITAVQYDGSNTAAIKDFLDDGIFGLGSDNHPVIHTLEGLMHVSPGDYVIRGVNGEFYR